jgi:hypothetical protein
MKKPLYKKINYCSIILAILFEVFRAEDQYSALESLIHELPGRPLLVQASKSTLLRKLDHSTIGRRKQINTRSLLLVRVDTSYFPSIYPSLNSLSDYVYYSPHDTFLVAIGAEYIEQLSSIEGVVQVFELPSALKLSRQLYSRSDTISAQTVQNLVWDAVNADNCSAAELNVLLSSAPSPTLLYEITSLCSDLNTDRPGSCLLAAGRFIIAYLFYWFMIMIILLVFVFVFVVVVGCCNNCFHHNHHHHHHYILIW